MRPFKAIKWLLHARQKITSLEYEILALKEQIMEKERENTWRYVSVVEATQSEAVVIETEDRILVGLDTSKGIAPVRVFMIGNNRHNALSAASSLQNKLNKNIAADGSK